MLRVEMLRRGIDHRELAAMIGYPPCRTANLLCGADTTWPLRRAINKALKMKIFAKPKGQIWRYKRKEKTKVYDDR